MVPKIKLSQACEGLLLDKKSTGKSPSTIAEYENTFKKLLYFFKDDPPIADLRREDLLRFFAWLQEDYVAQSTGIAPRGPKPLAQKSIRNIHTNLSSLWSWAVAEGFAEENPLLRIDKPAVNPPAVDPFTLEEVEALLAATARSRAWRTHQDVSYVRPTADRDQAILLTLLDTGIRASELCDIKFEDLNLDRNRIKIHGKSRGLEPKERFVFFGKTTQRALWRYLVPRLETSHSDDPIFLVGSMEDNRPMSRHVLYTLVRRIGERAGVQHVYPHRFRHTFAITFLRNGGDLFTLQEQLGHADLTMVKRYARVAQIDVAKAHEKASPKSRFIHSDRNWGTAQSLPSPGLMLMWDCNNGPGHDFFETNYLFFDLVQNLLG